MKYHLENPMEPIFDGQLPHPMNTILAATEPMAWSDAAVLIAMIIGGTIALCFLFKYNS